MYINYYFLYVHTLSNIIDIMFVRIIAPQCVFNNKPLGRLDEISIYELVLGFASKVAGKEGGEGV